MIHPDQNLIHSATLVFTAMMIVLAVLIIPWRTK